MNNFKIALNDTIETRLLVNLKFLNINYIKYPSIQRPCKEEFNKINYPKIYHGLVARYTDLPDILSDDFINNVNVEKTKYFLTHSNSTIISIHIGDNLKNFSDNECIKNAIKNIDFVKKYIQTKESYIALENMEDLSNFNTLNPKFIKRLVNETNTKFLFDTAHATVASNLLNMNIYEYVNNLPLDKLYEIHFSGTEFIDGHVLTHIRARKEDYELLEYVLNISSPKVVTLEYGLYDKNYSIDFLNNLPKVSYSKMNIEALNEILFMYYKVNKLRKK